MPILKVNHDHDHQPIWEYHIVKRHARKSVSVARRLIWVNGT
ncbi:MAG: hypothetical protein ACRD8W_02450 [Nitrososphaeraceae archaeon]